MLGAYRARAVPFNVNQHYRADGGPRPLRRHRRAGASSTTAATDRWCEAACDTSEVVLVDVDDGSGVAPLPGSIGYEEAAIAASPSPLPEPSPDDLYLVCTGGTTGGPKAVLWRQADIFVAAMGGTEGATAESLAARHRRRRGGPWYAVPPLMHAAAQWTAFCRPAPGRDRRPARRLGLLRRAARSCELAERERVALMSIVGDAYARPIVDELRRRAVRPVLPRDRIGTGGAATSERAQGGAARAAARRRDHRRLRRVGDRRHGLRRDDTAGQQQLRVRPEPRARP